MLKVLFITALVELAAVAGFVIYWATKASRQPKMTEGEREELRERLQARSSSFVGERQSSTTGHPQATLRQEVA